MSEKKPKLFLEMCFVVKLFGRSRQGAGKKRNLKSLHRCLSQRNLDYH